MIYLVDDYNRQCMLDFPGQLYEFQSSDTGNTRELSNLTAPRVLWLKISSPVILLRNLSGKLVNGLRGTVHDINEEGVTVEFPTLQLTTVIPKVKFTGIF